ncbi:MAG: hypothetical protein H7Y03_08475, partial [Chitinophagaceae bacterium]|nr:hypothetical protein [Chitinophagaceae bacterium]
MKISFGVFTFLLSVSIYSKAQRIELIETGIESEAIKTYAASYLSTKNWWL